jgi:hypothetical protein
MSSASSFWPGDSRSSAAFSPVSKNFLIYKDLLENTVGGAGTPSFQDADWFNVLVFSN